jgi:anionic cell wall polymer biosynthesis LytR-Cps2A-Psr (LCP) family protein
MQRNITSDIDICISQEGVSKEGESTKLKYRSDSIILIAFNNEMT